MAKIVHLTSVHVPGDNRIFHKQCMTAVAAGYDVVLVAPHSRDEAINGVRIRAVRPPANRFKRLLTTVPAVARAAIQERADVYQFHDPELMPVGLMLRMLGRRVIYDVHEDNVTSLEQKTYLPRRLRRGSARILGLVESLATRLFHTIVAEKYYQRRFPRGTVIQNYPLLERYSGITAQTPIHQPPRVLYTGGLSVDRGALHMVDILHHVPDVEVFMVGRCSAGLAALLRQRAGRHVGRLHIVGEGRYVPVEEIVGYYQRGGWLAGLAIFPRTPHYEQKELTKFFEYMAAGLPIVCSNFPCWKQLIEGHGVGVCVDPDRPEFVAETISYFADHPDEVREMGRKGRAIAYDFSWETEAAKLLSIYRDLLRRSRADGPIAALGR